MAPQTERLRKLLRGGNPSSGAIWVEGAQPGPVLSVHVGPIELDPLGFTRFRGGNGAMPSWLGGSATGEIYKIVNIVEGRIPWARGVDLPARPMLGFVGVAPAHERYHNG